MKARVQHLKREKFAPPQPRPQSRSVFVAKPGGDMHESYIRIVAELTKKGYNVIPSRTTEIPSDGTAASFIAAQLAKCEASVHLIGESTGWHPEGQEGIVKLQVLARRQTRDCSGAVPPFRRLIWTESNSEDSQFGRR